MNVQALYDYTLSTEELAMALSLINRPDLGKMVLLDNLGELSQAAIEERLKAASHSLLARKLVSIGNRGVAVLDDELQKALAPLILFEGIIQVVINRSLPLAVNVHLGLNNRCLVHWVEQGVVHRLIQVESQQVPQIVAEMVSLPHKISAKLQSKIEQSQFRISMETIAALTSMDSESSLKVLVENGLDTGLAKALLADLREPVMLGSLSYIPIDSKTMQAAHITMETPGVFFVTGKFSWILVFSGTGTPQVGSLLAGTSEVLEKCIQELMEARSGAFA